jgi:hypothetical protein
MPERVDVVIEKEIGEVFTERQKTMEERTPHA